MGYLNRPLLRQKSVEDRAYQRSIADKACEQNLLVILPTALGKTVISAIAVARLLSEYGGKIIVLAPTRPLVRQHHETFLRALDVKPEEMLMLMGTVSPLTRRRLWNEPQVRIIFSTPQVIWNDLKSGRYDLSKLTQVVFDEAHRARKKYAYTYIARRYIQDAEHPLILGLTASPGGKVEAVKEICENLSIERIEYRNEEDPDVKPYVPGIRTGWEKIKLPPEYLEISRLIREMLKKRLSTLRNSGLLKKPPERVGRNDLLRLGDKLRAMLEAVEADRKGPIYGMISLQSGCMSLLHALELLETQGLISLQAFLKRMILRANERRSLKSILRDPSYPELEQLVEKYQKIEHPKLQRLRAAVKEKLDSSPGSRILIFTQYRDTAAWIGEKLASLEGVSVERFVGQADRVGDAGLTQEEQVRILKAYREGSINVLCATSIAEEGLDIPQVDLVIFYEPIPSEIRYIQRRGRTGRVRIGEVLILAAEDTVDMINYWSSIRRVKQMRRVISKLNSELREIPRIGARIDQIREGVTNEIPTDSARDLPEIKPTVIAEEIPEVSNAEVSQAVRWILQRVRFLDQEVLIDGLIRDAEKEGLRRKAVLPAISKVESEGILYKPREAMITLTPLVSEKSLSDGSYIYRVEVEKVLHGRAIVWIDGKWRARLIWQDIPVQSSVVKKGARFIVHGELYRDADILCLRVHEFLGEMR